MTTEPEFDPAWEYGHTTRDGRPARVICTECLGARSIMAVYPDGGGRGEDREGRFFATGRYQAHETDLDLINAPAPKRTVWVNFFDDGSAKVQETREAADYNAGFRRIACTEMEVPERGTGLTGDGE